MSPQAWPLPKSLTSIFTGVIQTNFIRSEPGGTTMSGESPSTVTKAQVNEEARQSNSRDKKGQTGPKGTANPVTTSDRTSFCSSMSDMTTLAAADIVNDAKSSLDQLGVGISLVLHVSCSLNGRRSPRMSVVHPAIRNHTPNLQSRSPRSLNWARS